MSGMQKQQQQRTAKAAAKAKEKGKKSSQQLDARQMMTAPETLRSEDVLQAQQQVGNQVVQRALSRGARDTAVTDDQGNLKPAIASKIQQKRGSGEPLPEAVRRDARKALGKDFGSVRVHTDPTADKLSRTISARAFTIGSDIFFKKGVFSPGTSKGRETLMHELTHVVQQSGSKSAGGKLKLGAPGTAMEREAEQAGKQHSQAAAGPVSGASGTLQKQEAEEEELQMQQDEEEEVQMQPDPGNLIQRKEDDDEIVDKSGQLNRSKLRTAMGVGQPSQKMREKISVFGKSIFDKQNSDSSSEGQTKPLPKKKEGESDGTGSTSQRKEVVQPKNPQIGTPKQVNDSSTNTEDDSGVVPKPKTTIPKAPPLPKKKEDESDGTGSTSQRKEVVQPKNPQIGIPKQVNDSSTNTEDDSGVVPKPKTTIPKAPPLPKPKSTESSGPLSFSDQIKAKAKGMRTNSQREKLSTLEQDRMQKTGKRVSEQYLEDQANKPKSKMDRFKGFFSSMGSKLKSAGSTALKYGAMAGKAGLNKLGGAIKGQLSEAKDQVMGKKPETPKQVVQNVNVNPYGSGGSGGGSGGGMGGGMAETISELFQENKKLKAQIAELEKEKV